MSDKSFPARLHPILARDSNIALIFRRGPSKYVCTVLWNRKNDEFKIGQWLHGRIYERRSDITPDGKHLIYFAMNGKWQSEVRGSWTTISKTPWLKAVSLFSKGDCWNGGGLFINNDSYWLNDGYGHEVHKDTSSLKNNTNYQPEKNFGGECPGVYYHRLQRDGWTLKEHEKNAKYDSCTIFEKELPKNWLLVKTAHEQVGAPEGKGCYWDEHKLVNNETNEEILSPEWEWAEFDKDRLFYCEKGCLYKVAIQSNNKLGKPKLLYDFNEMKFEEIKAPY